MRSYLVLAVVLWTVPAFACVDGAELAYVWEATRPAIVRISALGTGPNCSVHGTGFFISPVGHILTAKHVVPETCSNLRVYAYREGGREVPVKVVRRSSLDVALLEAVQVLDVSYVALELLGGADAYLDRKVVVESFYYDGSRVTYTAAKVDDIHPVGASGKWILCGPAPNASRSGSPVLTPDGKVVAIFVEKPTGEQDRFRVVPMGAVSDLELANIPSKQAAVLSAVKPVIKGTANPSTVIYSFGVDLETSEHPPINQRAGRFIFYPNGRIEDASTISELEVGLRALNGGKVRYAERRTSTFYAFPGYQFTSDVLTIEPTSHNPPSSGLPDHVCTNNSDSNCFELSQDKRRVTVRATLFAGPAGIDQARGWLSGFLSVRMVQVP
jgi:hypothetical protein